MHVIKVLRSSDVEDNYKALAKLEPRSVLLTHIYAVGLLSSLFKQPELDNCP
jgi:hypothetical protein